MQPEISVIIPIYNAEKYIEDCVNSVLIQTFKDFELILVNDGSKDNSLALCEKLSKKDERIKIISQNNQGSSVARNAGLEEAIGKYIVYIDADDWMEPTMLETLHSIAVREQADIVGCGFYINKKDSIKTWRYPYRNEKEEELLHIHMGYSSLWNKLIRKKLLNENNIKGVKGVSMWDDNVITLPARVLSKKTVCIPDLLYHYRIDNEDSMCKTSINKYPHSEISATQYLIDYFASFSDSSLIQKSLSNVKVLAKEEILHQQTLGGVTMWKKILPVSIKDIWNSQLSNKRKLIRVIMILLPSSIGQKLANIVFK